MDPSGPVPVGRGNRGASPCSRSLVKHELAGAPVVDAQNRLVGLVSDFDLLCVETFMNAERCARVAPRP